MINIFLTIVFIYSFVVCRKIDAYHFDKCDVNLNSDLKILDTLNGKIKGECYTVPVIDSHGMKTNSKVMNWLSVPYAEPPINENRFKKSVPKKTWNKIIDGTSWPKHCVQFFLPNGTEDCLFLNIFVRKDVYMNRKTTLVPILFFIHGGGLVSGGISVDFYEGSTLAAYGEIVVVTIQYRLDSFGFLHLSNSFASGDQGFLDQNLALKWVHENAEKFGGDRNKITLSGESAGAISVGYHLMYEKSWAYFRNAILESGGPNIKTISLISSNEAERRSKELLYFLGCDKNVSNSELLNCAQKLDADLILNATFSFLRNNIFKKEIYSLLSGTHFPLVINNETFIEPIETIIEKKNVKNAKL
jgi:carboxylesterase type B